MFVRPLGPGTEPLDSGSQQSPMAPGRGGGVKEVRPDFLLPSQVALEFSTSVVPPHTREPRILKESSNGFSGGLFGTGARAVSALGGGSDVCAGPRPGHTDVSVPCTSSSSLGPKVGECAQSWPRPARTAPGPASRGIHLPTRFFFLTVAVPGSECLRVPCRGKGTTGASWLPT